MDRDRDIEIGRRLAALRAARGWSQGWLAAQAGMTQSVLSRVEAGKREARASELAELARALDVGPETLLEGSDKTGLVAREARLSRRETPERAPEAAPPSLESSAFRLAAPDAMRAIAAERLYSASGTPSDLDEALLDAAERQDERAFMRLDRLQQAWERDRLQHSIARESRQDVSPSPGLLADAAAHGRVAPAAIAALPAPVAQVIDDYVRLRAMTDAEVLRTASWKTIDAHGRRRRAGKPSGRVAGRPAASVNWNEPRDRYARLWRHELGIGVDGPVPDLVALFEDAGVAEVVVAQLETDEPMCATVTVRDPVYEPRRAAGIAAGVLPVPPGGVGLHDDVSFLFVNAQRPVTLQRHALAHAFAHLALGHGDVIDRRIEWSRAAPLESEANDFAEEFLAPVDAVARWYDRHDDPQPSVDVLLDLASAFGITAWAALYRSRAAGRLGPKPLARLSRELRDRQWALLPEQGFRGGLRDTLSTLSEEAPLPPAGAVGFGGVRAPLTRGADTAPAPGEPRRAAGAAVLRVPSRLRLWTLQALRSGALSLEQAAAVLHRPPAALAAELERLGLD